MKDQTITIIKLTDPNVDGCSTNVEQTIQICGPVINNTRRQEIQKEAMKYKQSNQDWDSDELFKHIINYLEENGYTVTPINHDLEIVLF